MGPLYFLLLIGVLITVHEFGHFLVARLSGVRVLKFAIGFGPKLIGFKRGHTEYLLALLPFGGYVKMEGDDPSAEVDPELREVSFLTTALWKRTLIVLAGPFFNFLLPLVVLFPLFLTKTDLQPALIGRVQPDGPAWQAGIRPGDRVTRIGDEEIRYWYELVESVGDLAGQTVPVSYERDGLVATAEVAVRTERVPYIKGFYEPEEGRIDVTSVFSEPRVHVRGRSAAARAGLVSGDRVLGVDGRDVALWEDIAAVLGNKYRHSLQVRVLRPRVAWFKERSEATASTEAVEALATEWLSGWLPRLITPSWAEVHEAKMIRRGTEDWGLSSSEFELSDVVPGSAADAALGLRRGDYIQSVDGRRFGMWLMLERYLIESVGKEHVIVFERDGEVKTQKFTLLEELKKGEFNVVHERVVFGAVGTPTYTQPPPIPNDSLVSYAAWRTFDETARIVRITVFGIGGLMTGSVPLREMGGPILIAQVAAKTTEEGWTYFLNILVWISVNLGLLNLLPIPVLDGGHLMVFAVEAVMRRSISLRARTIVAYIGLAMILVLTLLVFTNDIMRNWESIKGFFVG